MSKLTMFRYYFNKMDNIQRSELVKKMGVSIETIYKRAKKSEDLSLQEAKAFKQCVYDFFGKTISLEDLTLEIAPVEQGGGE